MSKNLNTVMRGLAEHLHQARTMLPGIDDPNLLVIAEALFGAGIAAPPPPKSFPAFPTLKAAITDYLESVDNARTGEIYEAMRDRCPGLLSDKNPYDSVSQMLQSDAFERVCRGRYRIRPEPAADVTIPTSPSAKAKMTMNVAAKLTQPFLARDVVNNSHLKMPWVIVGLKELNKAGKVKIVEKLTNGMARWAIVTD